MLSSQGGHPSNADGSQRSPESYLPDWTSLDHWWAAPRELVAGGWPDPEDHPAGGTTISLSHLVAPQTVQ